MSNGFEVFDVEPGVLRWANAAANTVQKMDTSERRHGRTWFVGVDALPNAADGSVEGVPLAGTWMEQLADHPRFDGWHAAQVSIVYDGYPKRDAEESEAAHRFRVNRDAAHMDGLLPEGPERRRHLREAHAFIVGMPLNAVAASPLVVWPGSHMIMQDAFRNLLEGHAPASWGDLDVTETYQAARRQVFETCDRVEVPLVPGQAVLLHRHLVHGVAPWAGPAVEEGRQVAYFRPLVSELSDWL